MNTGWPGVYRTYRSSALDVPTASATSSGGTPPPPIGMTMNCSQYVEQLPHEMQMPFRRRRKADKGRLGTPSPHAVGDLEGARRVLPEAKGVEHLVDYHGLRE